MNILNHKQSINLYYKNQFHSNYKIDEHIFKKKNILENVFLTDPTKKVRLIIYYNKFKASNLIISEFLERTNILYMFKCPMGD